jgi:hypothetical protein
MIVLETADGISDAERSGVRRHLEALARYARDERGRVLCLRRDGDYGLVEPR